MSLLKCSAQRKDFMTEITLEEIEQYVIERERRRKNSWAACLVRVLWPYSERGMLRLDAIYAVQELRTRLGVSIPPTLEHTVQSAYNSHCEGSKVFAARNVDEAEAFFHPVGRKGSGRWAVYRGRVEVWLKKKRLNLDEEGD